MRIGIPIEVCVRKGSFMKKIISIILTALGLVGCSDISVIKTDLALSGSTVFRDTFEFYAFRKLEESKIVLYKFSPLSIEKVTTYEPILVDGSQEPLLPNLVLEVNTLNDINNDGYNEAIIINHKFFSNSGNRHFRHSIVDGKTGSILSEIRTEVAAKNIGFISNSEDLSQLRYYVQTLFGSGALVIFSKNQEYLSDNSQDLTQNILFENGLRYIKKQANGTYLIVTEGGVGQFDNLAVGNSELSSFVHRRTLTDTMIVNYMDVDHYVDSMDTTQVAYDYLVEKRFSELTDHTNIFALFDRALAVGNVYAMPFFSDYTVPNPIVTHIFKDNSGLTRVLTKKTPDTYAWRDLTNDGSDFHSSFDFQSDLGHLFVFEQKVRPNYNIHSISREFDFIFYITNSVVDSDSNNRSDLILLECNQGLVRLKTTNLETFQTVNFRLYPVSKITSEICN